MPFYGKAEVSTISGGWTLGIGSGRRRVYNEVGFSDQPHRYSVRCQFGPSGAPATLWVAGSAAGVAWNRGDGIGAYEKSIEIAE
jgi:hypothetical protein